MRIKIVLVSVLMLVILGFGFGGQTIAETPQGYTFRLGAVEEPDSLDVWSTNGTSGSVIAAVYEGLTTFMNSEVKLCPALAKSWKISEDGKTYTFYLREGVKFTDGAPFNAEAAKFGFERSQGIAFGPAKYIEIVKQVEIVDEYTLKVHLTDSSSGFLNTLRVIRMVSPKAVEEHRTEDDPWARNWFNNHSAGTGPYILDKWVPSQYIHVVRNENYWGGWEPNQAKDVYVMIVLEPSAQRLMLEKGDLDFAPHVTIADALDLQGFPGITVKPIKTLVTIALNMNTAQGPLSNLLVRRALAHCFDFEEYKELRSGYATPLEGPFLQAFTEGPIEGLCQYPYDLDKAQELLSRAGYKPEELKLKAAVTTGKSEWIQLVEVLQEGLRKIDVDLELRQLPWPTIVEQQSCLRADNWDIIPYQAASENGTAAPVAKLTLHSDGIGYRNLALYENHLVDDLIDKAMKTADKEKRIETEGLIARIVMEECPIIYASQITVAQVMRSWVKELDMDPLHSQFYDFYSIRFGPEKGQQASN